MGLGKGGGSRGLVRWCDSGDFGCGWVRVGSVRWCSGGARPRLMAAE
ncbi:hypothetical protein ACJIZ3_012498 [Penstemon smallii]|uniref:Uncharacterized protein n=1 Tax=Penstemon smallii TaxID=265156 RepID=A0ABD3UNR9_9LAMI